MDSFAYVIAGATYLATLCILLFLLMPLISGLYATTPPKGAGLIMGSYLSGAAVFVISGYRRTVETLSGMPFHAEYWSNVFVFEPNAIGYANLVWTVVSWLSFACASAILAFMVLVFFRPSSKS